MSPLLAISLAIVLILWVVPMTWALSIGVRALQRWVRAIIDSNVQAPSLLKAAKENSRSLDGKGRSEEEYQKRRDELIRKRALLAQSLDRKAELERRIPILAQELQALEAKIGEPEVARRLQDISLRSQLSCFQAELDELDAKLEFERDQLEDAELEFHKAYPGKKALFATPDIQSKIVKKSALRSEQTVEEKIRRIELAVAKREVQVSFRPVYYLSLDALGELTESIEGLCLDSMKLEDNIELMQTVDDHINMMYAAILASEPGEELLKAQLNASAAEFESWRKKVEEAEREGNTDLVELAKAEQAIRKAVLLKHKSMLGEYRKLTAEVRKFEIKFYQLREKIQKGSAIGEPELLDFTPDG